MTKRTLVLSKKSKGTLILSKKSKPSMTIEKKPSVPYAKAPFIASLRTKKLC